jgi:WD40 repeat protein
MKIVYRPEAAFGIRSVSFCSATLPGHQHTILCIAFSNTGNDLATGGGDGTVIFWDMVTQSMSQRVEIKNDQVHAVIDVYSATAEIAGWSVVSTLLNISSPIVFV